MSDIWTYTSDSFSGTKTADNLGMSPWSLNDGSLKVGELTFTQVFDTAAQAIKLVEEDKFFIYRNGVKWFHGWVTSVRCGGSNNGAFMMTVTISDVMYWFDKILLSGMAKGSDGGDLKEVAEFGFGEGDAREHIIAVIDRLRSFGVEVEVGGISSMFPIPQVTIKQASHLEALRVLLSYVSDMMMWVNHRGEKPTINIKRRGVAGVVDLVDGTAPLDSWELEKMWTLEMKQALVSYVRRASNGLTVFDEQVAGVADAVRRAIFPVSGGALHPWLPYDRTDSQTVRSRAIFNGNEVSYELVKALVPDVAEFDAAYSDFFLQTPEQVTFGSGGSGGASYTIYDYSAAKIFTKRGEVPSSSYQYFLSKGEYRDWFEALGVDYQELRCVGHWMFYRLQSVDPPSWIENFPFIKHASGTLADGSAVVASWIYLDIPVLAVNQNWSTDTVLNKPVDYDYVQPPAGFADNLLAAQNFAPYDGTIQMTNEEAGEVEYRGQCYNIQNALPEHAVMKAMVQSRSVTSDDGITTLTMGVPERFRFQDLLTLKDRTKADSIFWINGTDGSGGVGGSFGFPSDGSGGIPTIGSSGGSTSSDNGTGDTTDIGIGGENGDVWEDQDDDFVNGAGSAGGSLQVQTGYQPSYDNDEVKLAYVNLTTRRPEINGVGIGYVEIAPFTPPDGYSYLTLSVTSSRSGFTTTSNLPEAGGTVALPIDNEFYEGANISTSNLDKPFSWPLAYTTDLTYTIKLNSTTAAPDKVIETGVLKVSQNFTVNYSGDGVGGGGRIGRITLRYTPPALE